jgi:Predicted esterase
VDSIVKKDLIIYIHGWNSSGNARKAKLLKDELATNTHYEVASYTLKSYPREAIKQLTEIIESEKKSRKVHLIGSSLGGYYAVYLAESLNLKAAMVNPAVWAYKIFENDRGENLNPNTNEKYVIDQEWIDSLEEIFIETPNTNRYLVLLQTADETLDYRYAEKYFSGSKTIIDEGGSHSFEDLESKIPKILKHFS